MSVSVSFIHSFKISVPQENVDRLQMFCLRETYFIVFRKTFYIYNYRKHFTVRYQNGETRDTAILNYSDFL